MPHTMVHPISVCTPHTRRLFPQGWSTHVVMCLKDARIHSVWLGTRPHSTFNTCNLPPPCSFGKGTCQSPTLGDPTDTIVHRKEPITKFRWVKHPTPKAQKPAGSQPQFNELTGLCTAPAMGNELGARSLGERTPNQQSPPGQPQKPALQLSDLVHGARPGCRQSCRPR